MAAKHNGHFGTWSVVLACGGVGIENNAECTFRVLLKRDRARDQVTETTLREEGRGAVVEIYNHNRYARDTSEFREGGDESREVLARDGADCVGIGFGGLVICCFDLVFFY